MTGAGAAGVYVLGMHRSGTSATTRAVNLLGVPVGDESALKEASGNNPSGFWEVPRLTNLNNRLLFELGGSSLGPPELEPGWERRPALERRRRRAAKLFANVHTGPSWVWKDPRNCITLPFWLEALPARPVVLLVHRDPLAIARSLETRQGLSRAMSLAVWERYLREALTHVRDLPVLVTRYADLVERPTAWGEATGAFLDGHEVKRERPTDVEELERFVEHGGRDGSAAPAPGDEMSPAQHELIELLESLTGAHERFAAVDLPAETGSTEPLLAERRRADLLRVQMQERIGAMRKRLKEARADKRSAEQELDAVEGGAGRGQRPRSRSGEASSNGGRLPDFIIVGAQKSGTSSLYRWLGEAASIEVPSKKELHFFDTNFRRGADWYRSFFAGRDGPSAGALTGEATPYYLFHPLAPARVRETVPEVRLIAVLRNPVERAVSHYYHELGNGVESLPLEAALDQEPDRLAGEAERMVAEPGYESFNHRHFSYQARGVYVDQLEDWRKHFPADQLLVVKSERLFEDTAAEMGRVMEFLGVEPEPPEHLPAWNQRAYPSVPPEVERRLAERFAADNERLYRLIGEDFGW
jgi:hypothetical protein